MLAGLGVARADGLDPIAVRQAGLDLQGGDFAFIRAVVAAKGDVKPLEAPAAAIAKWTGVIPTLFPKGTVTGGNTKALPEIWSDPAGFQKIALAANAAALKLAAARRRATRRRWRPMRSCWASSAALATRPIARSRFGRTGSLATGLAGDPVRRSDR